MKDHIFIREILKEDCAIISEAFAEQGWDKPVSQFLKYYELQSNGSRDILIAEYDNEFSGYLTINWHSDYQQFKQKKIPEIVDFNVLKKYQRKGIGTQLMDEAENRMKRVSTHAGIAFGVYEDYGAAQILYIKRGYIPDGRGLVKDSKPLKYGDQVLIDDSVVMCLTKEL